MPQSNNQISPRLGGTLLLFDHRSQVVTSSGSHVVAEFSGFPWRKLMNQLSYEFLFFLSPKRLKFG